MYLNPSPAVPSFAGAVAAFAAFARPAEPLAFVDLVHSSVSRPEPGTVVYADGLADGTLILTIVAEVAAWEPSSHAVRNMTVSELGKRYRVQGLFKHRLYDVRVEAETVDGRTVYERDMTISYSGGDLADVRRALLPETLQALATPFRMDRAA